MYTRLQLAEKVCSEPYALKKQKCISDMHTTEILANLGGELKYYEVDHYNMVFSKCVHIQCIPF